MLQKIKSFKNKLLFPIHTNSFVEDSHTTGEFGIPVILSKINKYLLILPQGRSIQIKVY